jgi:hypothetical protein
VGCATAGAWVWVAAGAQAATIKASPKTMPNNSNILFIDTFSYSGFVVLIKITMDSILPPPLFSIWDKYDKHITYYVLYLCRIINTTLKP